MRNYVYLFAKYVFVVIMLSVFFVPVDVFADQRQLASSFSEQQTEKVTVKGFVKDLSGESIIGASVVEKGMPNNGTITGVDGEYSLTVTSGAELIISYIGYTTVTLKIIPNVTQYDVTMKEDAQGARI